MFPNIRLALRCAIVAQWVTYYICPAIIVLFQEKVFFDVSLTVKAAPHECVIRTGQPKTKVKAENEAWFYSKVTVSSSAITAVII